MIEFVTRNGKRPGEFIYEIKPAALLDGIDYIKVPLGYQAHLWVKEAEGASVEVYLTNANMEEETPPAFAEFVKVDLPGPLFATDVACSWIMISATGSVSVRGYLL